MTKKIAVISPASTSAVVSVQQLPVCTAAGSISGPCQTGETATPPQPPQSLQNTLNAMKGE